jgi:hypothetical protein
LRDLRRELRNLPKTGSQKNLNNKLLVPTRKENETGGKPDKKKPALG